MQLLIIYLHELLRLLQYLPCLGNHQADSVTHAPCDASLCDHHIPVLLQMSHLIIRDVIRCQDGEHAGQGFCLLRVDIKDTCPRIFGADCRCIDHAVHLHVIRILSISKHFFTHVETERMLPYAVDVAFFQICLDLCISPQDRSGKLDALDDLFISGAAAYISL